MIIQLVLIQVITFVVILVVLNLLFGRQLKAALKRLQVLHQESLEKEEVLNKEIERARIQSQGEISRSKDEAKKIIENARLNAEKIAAEAGERAELNAKKMMADAQERAKGLEAEILASVEEKSVGLAQELIKYTFTQKSCEALQAQLIDELIEELKGVDKERLAVEVDRIEVLTSSALTPEAKERLKDILKSKVGQNLVIEEKVDPSLIMGMVIKLGGLVVDGSLKNKLSKAVVALRTQR